MKNDLSIEIFHCQLVTKCAHTREGKKKHVNKTGNRTDAMIPEIYMLNFRIGFIFKYRGIGYSQRFQLIETKFLVPVQLKHSIECSTYRNHSETETKQSGEKRNK